MESVENELLKIFCNLRDIRQPNFLDEIEGEERIELLEDHIKSIFQGIQVPFAQVSQTDLDELPMKIKKSIQLYSEASFREINSFLRENQGYVRGTGAVVDELDLNTFDTHTYYLDGVVDSLDLVINQHESDKDVILYRGCSISQFQELGVESAEELKDYVGDSMIEHSFLSTTTSLGGQFVTYSPIVLAIHVPAGSHFLPMDSQLAIKGEKEVLLERETRLSIGGVEKIGDQHFVYMRSTPLDKDIVSDIDQIRLTDHDQDLELSSSYDDSYDTDVASFFDDIDDDFDISPSSKK